MSFAEDQITRLETLLADNVGVKSVNVDGVNVQYDDLLKQYEFWQRKFAIEEGTRPRVAQINLSGF